ncbi:MAG: GDP-4-dehydro-6-deoxy-D-mannose reductase [Candidatus Omnitrophota bacterium]|jgi:GDP-4-dehydro-6-deoxy-D-mannose reductase
MPRKFFHSCLITGIAGSGGSYLAEYIAQFQPDVVIHGIARKTTKTRSNLDQIKDKVQVHECDLNDFERTFDVIQTVKPDVIFNLASNADVHASFENANAVMSNNILGTSNLFEAVRQQSPKLDTIIQHCSTSEVYGQVDPKDVPINEDCRIRPSSPYAVSKTAQDMLAYTHFRSYGTKIIRTRMFSYVNPKRADLFASAFARQVARIELGLQEILVHGNLDSIRTLIDVRDAMEAYWVAAQYCVPGDVYNIGGNTSISVGDFLEILKKEASVKIESKVNPALLRPADVTLQVPDVSKFADITNWAPKYSFNESVKFLLDYWRERVATETA